MVSIISEHITINPGFCGGQPCITGHRIKVQDVVILHEEMGMSPEEIIYHYPSITLADVYAALTYYHDHREEIRTQIREDETFVGGLQAQNPYGNLYLSKKAMPTYNEVLKQAQSLSIIDQFQLLKDLQKIVSQGVEVEGTDEVIPAVEIAESEAALADYLAGRDLGKSLKQVELELFGRELD